MLTRSCRRIFGAAIVTAVFGLSIAGCSSSGSKSSSAANTTSSSNASSSTASGSSTGSSSGNGVAAAQADVAKLTKTPTTIGPTTPLKSVPPQGKLIVDMECQISCSDIAAGIRAAANAVHWKYKSIQYSSTDPASLVSALKQALQLHPAAVTVQAIPEPAWASVLPAYKAAGVPIIAGSVIPANIDDTVIANIGDQGYAAQVGRDLASWFVADSNGKGRALMLTSNDIGAFKVFADGFTSGVSSQCTGCSVDVKNIALADVNKGGMITTAISELQRDPSIKYVFSVNGPVITGLAKQLSAAGLAKNVKIGGIDPDATNLTNVKAGTEAAWVSSSLVQSGWSAMDAALRHVEGMPMDPNEAYFSTQLLTKDVSFTVANSLGVPSDYAEQYKKLWKV